MTVILTNRDDILVYVRDDIRSRIVECKNLPSSFEGLIIELSINLKKWQLICSYNSHRNSVKEHIRVLSCFIDQNFQKLITLESRKIISSPPLIVNFLIFFHPGHLYSNRPYC